MGLPQNKTKLLREFVNKICENCHKHEDLCGKLEAHRIKRGNNG